MEVTLDALDWDKLQEFGDSSKFAEWRLELEDEPDWIKSHEDVGWLNDIASVYLDIADALEASQNNFSESQQTAIQQSLLTVMCGDDSKTRRDFPCIPDSCYFISLSPETVVEAQRSLQQVDLSQVAKVISAPLAEEWEVEDRAPLEEGLIEYFGQVQTLVEFAASRGWGVIGHMG